MSIKLSACPCDTTTALSLSRRGRPGILAHCPVIVENLSPAKHVRYPVWLPCLAVSDRFCSTPRVEPFTIPTMRAFLNQPVEPHTGVIECMIRRKKGVMNTVYQAFYEVRRNETCCCAVLCALHGIRCRKDWSGHRCARSVLCCSCSVFAARVAWCTWGRMHSGGDGTPAHHMRAWHSWPSRNRARASRRNQG